MEITLIDKHDDSFRLRVSEFDKDELLFEIKGYVETKEEVCLSREDAEKLYYSLHEYLKK